jgi:DNA modification methylase
MLIWAKNNHVLGRCDYHYQHEPVLYGWVEGAGHHFYGGHSETSLWAIDKPQHSDLHPTTKPVELYARAIRNSSEPGDVVADIFAGSGTAIIAAESLGRRCRAMEIDPTYVAVALQRYVDTTGTRPVLLEAS